MTGAASRFLSARSAMAAGIRAASRIETGLGVIRSAALSAARTRRAVKLVPGKPATAGLPLAYNACQRGPKRKGTGPLLLCHLRGPVPFLFRTSKLQFMCRLLVPALEELHGPFVLLGLLERVKGAEVAALAGARVELSGVQAIVAGSQFAYHACLLAAASLRSSFLRREKSSLSV